MKATATVSPIADIDETDNGKELFIVSRIREKLLNKLRLLRDYYIKIVHKLIFKSWCL